MKATYFKGDNIVTIIKEGTPTAFIAMRLYDQSFVEHKESSREERLAKDQMYLHHKGNYQKVKIIYQEEKGE